MYLLYIQPIYILVYIYLLNVCIYMYLCRYVCMYMMVQKRRHVACTARLCLDIVRLTNHAAMWFASLTFQ